MFTLNILQQIFTLFFAILFGVMLGSLDKFNPFPFDKIKKNSDYNSVRKRRLIISLIFLNILPFIYFILILCFLEYYYDHYKDNLNVYLLMGVPILFALSVFLFYRLYHVFAKIGKDFAFKDVWKCNKFDKCKEFNTYRNAFATFFYFILPWIFIILIQIYYCLFNC